MKGPARYLVAVVVTAIGLYLTVALQQFLAPMRLFFLWAAVLITAVLAGVGPAIVAIALSVAGAAFLVLGPEMPMESTRLVLFALFAGGISIAVGTRRAAEERAAASNVRLTAEVDVRRRQEERIAFINRASEVLSSSLGVERTMRNLARLCVPSIGDWCGIDIGAPDSYERLVTEHTDVTRLQLVQELDRFRPAPDVDPIAQVIHHGRSQLIEELTDDFLAAVATSPEHLAMAKTLGLRSVIIAPMIARGRTLGALTVVYGESGRRYTQDDVPFIEDLARRAAIAIDNARLYEAAESANRAKDEFLATLSHELRTPLTAISGWAHMLQLGMTDEKTTRTAVDTILRSAKAQGELIDDLLDLSRVVAGTLHLHVVTADLSKIVEDAIVSARPAVDAKRLQLEVAVAPDVLVRGDDRRLHQIVWNLLTNAVKFTDAGGSVRVELTVRGALARVVVRDTGRGIDPVFLPYVWDRFRQGDSTTSREHGGLGLGLAVVRHLAELHGGTVRAESEGLGRGATFAVELPLARRGERAATVRSRPSTDGVLTGKHVLVVDDDDDARFVLAAMLRQAGAEVVTASSVAQALSAFAAEAFDAVVSDIAMPGEDGYALVAKLRETSQVPVIAVSAIASGHDDRRHALDAGFDDFVRKPVEPGELTAAVANAIG